MINLVDETTGIVEDGSVTGWDAGCVLLWDLLGSGADAAGESETASSKGSVVEGSGKASPAVLSAQHGGATSKHPPALSSAHSVSQKGSDRKKLLLRDYKLKNLGKTKARGRDVIKRFDAGEFVVAEDDVNKIFVEEEEGKGGATLE